MKVTDLDYNYPDELIAIEPKADFRTLWVDKTAWRELKTLEILAQFSPGDVLVINDTQVSPRRLFSAQGLEILFLRELGRELWEVLFPARDLKIGDEIELPEGVKLKLTQKGLPQTVQVNRTLTSVYFDKHGELALPPYIQKARGERHMRPEDREWYQTQWAARRGSCAAPTASLHFKSADLEQLKNQGVKVVPVTLHVGLGTFLPIKTENLSDHRMHEEWCSIPVATQQAIEEAKSRGARVWALGTTVTRTLESWGAQRLKKQASGDLSGPTDLFITPGFEFRVVDMLMTNFHQPRSTLLALVCAFAGRERVLEAYQWAVKERFRLFSYGDLSIWIR